MKQRFDVPMSRHHSVGYCSAVPKGVFPLPFPHWSDLSSGDSFHYGRPKLEQLLHLTTGLCEV